MDKMKWQAAKLMVVNERPYFAHALWAVREIEKPGFGTLGVTKDWKLYVDPNVVDQWTTRQIASVLLHEIYHLLREHHDRAPANQEEFPTWMIAADLEINDDLEREKGVELPGNYLHPKKFGLPEDKPAEWYFNKISEQKNQNTQGQGAGKGNKKEGAARGNGQENEQNQGGGSDNDQGAQAPGCLAESDENDGESGLTRAEIEVIKRRVAEEIVQHSKSRGNVPGELRRWAEQILNPKVDWRRELAASIRNATAIASGMDDYSYERRSRRQIGRVILPGMVRPEPNVAVVVDTSGSMDDKDLARALGEVKGILRATQSAITVLATDAAVHTTQKVFKAEDIDLIGGAGTDMGKGIEASEKLRPRPDVLIVVTDGWTPWPEEKPRIRKVVVVLTRPDKAKEVPCWAKVIIAEPEEV